MPESPDNMKYLLVYGSITMLLLTVFIIVLVNLYQRRHHSYLMEKSAMAAAFANELVQARIELREDTMKRLGDDLHDHVSPSMGRIVQDMNLIHEQMERNLIPKELVSDARTRLAMLQNEVRYISKTMSAITLENFGLAEALQEQVEKLHNTQGTEVRLEWHGSFVQLDKQVELVLYRMAQETIGNALKYAEAIHIDVILDYLPDQLIVSVMDNGKGFDTEKIKHSPEEGTGLRRLSSRARNIGAELKILSIPGEGTTVSFSLPYANHETV